ncbi:MAG: Asp-tRNA(Asn)/Glu-tRNA(Gln) amidotransferase subunit GatB [Planctomycetaceae bacterium]|nr:Asp-tRNA(Asn)/Glu-tRNA(Gln) amidotransferase subunit GatB [Planctomycetaceae bacterium]
MSNSLAPALAYETIVGLEIHVQLATKSKLFCGCATRYGQPPNSQTCPICQGLPGTLPVINQHAIELAMDVGLALDMELVSGCRWDRKHYFYPDLPKGYQTSQYDLPITRHGRLEFRDPADSEKTCVVRINRAHLEEDAGKSLHGEGIDGGTWIDLNRTGTPLLEVVTEPDLRSAQEAKAFLIQLRTILLYLGVSDCNMQEGSMRVDANVNLRIKNETETIATPIVEIKNLNSFRNAERAIEYERERQLKHWRETGERMGQRPKQTRGWDADREVTTVQREKEEAADYRYFPCPDLPPVVLSQTSIDQRRAQLPRLPQQWKSEFTRTWKLSEYDASVIVEQGRDVAEYFETVAQISQDGKRSANWITQEILRLLNERQQSISDFPIAAAKLGELVSAVSNSELDHARAREIFALWLTEPISLREAKERLGIATVSGNEVEELVNRIVAENQAAIDDYRHGKKQALGPLIAQAKQLNSNVSPAKFREALLRAIDST